jgi:hypothetical protein
MFSCFLIKGYSEAHQKLLGGPLRSTRKPAFRYAETHEMILGGPMCFEQILYFDVEEYAEAHSGRPYTRSIAKFAHHSMRVVSPTATWLRKRA